MNEIQTTKNITIWGMIAKYFHLLLLTYLFLYIFPFPIIDIPFPGNIFIYYQNLIEYLTYFVGKNVLNLQNLEKIKMTGSGDTTFNYVEVLTKGLLSIIVSLIIFIFTYRRINYNKIQDYIIIYCRYFLGLTIMSYGFAKLYEGQFSFPGLGRLEQSLGEMSPMGLLWTFMGYSKSYTFFVGLCEVLGGFFLLFRKTTVIGGIITFSVMLNVVMLNFTFDVPVKLFSTHLALLALFIIHANLINVFNFLALGKTSQLIITSFYTKKKWIKYGRLTIKYLLIIGIPGFFIFTILFPNKRFKSSKLDATYVTEEFTRIKSNATITKEDSTSWKKVVLENNYSKIFLNNGESFYCLTTIDTTKKTISLKDNAEDLLADTLKYKYLTDSTLLLTGKIENDSLTARFRIKTLKNYPLVKRGFHWINEYPYNR